MLTSSQEIIAQQTETCRILCPECSADRKKRDKTLSVTVNVNEILYHCHHCSFTGMIPNKPFYEKYQDRHIPPKVTPIPTQYTKDTKPIHDFFSRRGITIDDMSDLPPMTTGKKYFGKKYGEMDAIGFIYGSAEQPDAIKWRSIDKKLFTQQGAASEFYGLGQLKPDDKQIIIVEGEADVIALAAVGITAISCPNGAPLKVSNRRISAQEDKKFSYVWDAKEILEGVEKIILAVDHDDAGDALAEELARRVGREKCWRVHYPEPAEGSQHCKDPNDVLYQHGTKMMVDIIKQAEALPLVGVYEANTYVPDLLEIYKKGFGHGESTGLTKVDELFTVKEGLMYIVTGIPSSGKSEFVDQLMVNLAREKSWKFAVASFENPPAWHMAKMAEKIVEKPFFEGLSPRMGVNELQAATNFINDHFVFLESKDGSLPTIRSILERTKMAIMRLGVRALVIDPYNMIQQEQSESEHVAINKMLTTITAFAQANGVAVFFVAHPAKMYPNQSTGKMPIATGHHISGSAAWFAKADVGITVHRGEMGVEIHTWKMRFKWIGSQGSTTIGYDVPTGRYFDVAEDEPKKAEQWDFKDEGWDKKEDW